MEVIKIGDIVAFNPYPEEEGRKPAYGKVKRIGTRTELNMFNLSEDDGELIYELESLNEIERYRIIFTRTTGKWITKVDYDLVKSKKFRTFE